MPFMNKWKQFTGEANKELISKDFRANRGALFLMQKVFDQLKISTLNKKEKKI